MIGTILATILLIAPPQKPVAPAKPKTVCTQCKHEYVPGQALSRQEVWELAGSAASRAGTRLSRTGHDTVVKIVKKESTYNPAAKNRGTRTRKPTSAFGLMGFLNATWKGTGVKKTLCPHCQLKAGLIYIRNRYGTPEDAWRHHQKFGFY